MGPTSNIRTAHIARKIESLRSASKQASKQTNKQTNRKIIKQTNKQTNKQRARKTDTNKQTSSHASSPERRIRTTAFLPLELKSSLGTSPTHPRFML